jgi:WD40 repeat protein
VNNYVPKHEKYDFELPNPKIGVGLIEWSFDGKYICSREDSTPNVLFVWDCVHLQLHSVLVHTGEIKSAKWCPTENRLAVASGNGRINFWSTEGCSCVDVPESKMVISSVKWSQNGKSLILSDGLNFCCSFLAKAQ